MWIFVLMIISSLSGIYGVDHLKSGEYIEEYEDEVPLNTTYKLNVPDSFKTYLEHLLTKGNSKDKDVEEKVNGSKEHLKREEENYDLKNHQVVNQTNTEGIKNAVDIDKNLQSLVNSLDKTENLHDQRPKIYHPYRIKDISQLLNGLGKGSSVSHLRNPDQKHSFLRKNDTGSTKSLTSTPSLQEIKSSNQVQLVSNQPDTKRIKHTAKPKLTDEEILKTNPSERNSTRNTTPSNAVTKLFNKSNVHTASVNSTKNIYNLKDAVKKNNFTFLESSGSASAMNKPVINLTNVGDAGSENKASFIKPVFNNQTAKGSENSQTTTQRKTTPEIRGANNRDSPSNASKLSSNVSVLSSNHMSKIKPITFINSNKNRTNDQFYNFLETNIGKGNNNKTNHIIENTNKDNILFPTSSVSPRLKDYTTTETKYATPNNKNNNRINSESYATPSDIRNNNPNIKVTSSPLVLGMKQGLKELVSKNNNKETLGAKQLQERNDKYSSLLKEKDKIASHSSVNIQTVDTSMLQNNKSNKPSVGPIQKFSLSLPPENNLNTSNTTNLQKSVYNTLNSASNLVGVGPFPNNMTTQHSSPKHLDGVVNTFSNKIDPRKRKIQIKPSAKVDKVNNLNNLTNKIYKENPLETAKSGSKIHANNSATKEIFNFKKSSGNGKVPKSYSGSAFENKNESSKRPLNYSSNISESINNENNLVNNPSLKNFGNGVNESFKNRESNSVTGVKNSNQAPSSYESKHNLKNGKVNFTDSTEPYKIISQPNSFKESFNKNPHSDIKSHTIGVAPSFINNNIVRPVHKPEEIGKFIENVNNTIGKVDIRPTGISNTTDVTHDMTRSSHSKNKQFNIKLENESPHFKGHFDSTVNQQNKEVHRIKNETPVEDSTAVDPNRKLEILNNNETIKSSVNNIIQDVNKPKNTSSSEDLDLVNREYSFNMSGNVNNFGTTPLGPDQVKRNEEEKHPIQDLLNSLIKIHNSKKIIKRRKKNRTVGRKLSQKEQLNIENEPRTKVLQSNIKNNINVLNITKPKPISKTQQGTVLLKPIELDISLVNETSKQPISYSEPRGVSLEGVTNLAHGKSNSPFKSIDTYKQENVISLPGTDVLTRNKENIISTTVSKTEAPSEVNRKNNQRLLSKIKSNMKEVDDPLYSFKKPVLTKIKHVNGSSPSTKYSHNVKTVILNSPSSTRNYVPKLGPDNNKRKEINTSNTIKDISDNGLYSNLKNMDKPQSLLPKITSEPIKTNRFLTPNSNKWISTNRPLFAQKEGATVSSSNKTVSPLIRKEVLKLLPKNSSSTFRNNRFQIPAPKQSVNKQINSTNLNPKESLNIKFPRNHIMVEKKELPTFQLNKTVSPVLRKEVIHLPPKTVSKLFENNTLQTPHSNVRNSKKHPSTTEKMTTNSEKDGPPNSVPSIKTDVQQKSQGSKSKGIEGIVYEIYNMLKQYIGKTNKGNIGQDTGITSRSQELSSSSKGRLQRIFTKKDSLEHKTKHSSLPQKERDQTKHETGLSDTKQRSDWMTVEPIPSKDFQKLGGKPLPGSHQDKNNYSETKVGQPENIQNNVNTVEQHINVQTNKNLVSRDKIKNKTFVDQNNNNSEIYFSTKSTPIKLTKLQGEASKKESLGIQVMPPSNRVTVHYKSDKNSSVPTYRSITHEFKKLNNTKKTDKNVKPKHTKEIKEKIVNKSVNNSLNLLRGTTMAPNLTRVNIKLNQNEDQVNKNSSSNIPFKGKHQTSGVNNKSKFSKENVINVNRKRSELPNTYYHNLSVGNVDARNSPELRSRVSSKNNVSDNNSKIQTQKVNTDKLNNLKNKTIHTQHLNGDRDYSKSSASLKPVQNIQKEKSLDSFSRLELPPQLQRIENPTQNISGNNKKQYLKIEKSNNYKRNGILTTNTNSSAKKLQPNNTLDMMNDKTMNNNINPNLIITNKKKENKQGPFPKERHSDSSINKNFAHGLDKNNRLHIIVTPLDNKPNLSVEVSVENTNGSTNTNPFPLQNKQFINLGRPELIDENKNASKNTDDSSGLLGSYDNKTLRAIPSFKLLRRVNNENRPNKPNSTIKPLLANNQLHNDNSPQERKTNSSNNPESPVKSKPNIVIQKSKNDSSTSKDIPLDVKHSSKVINRKKISKKEEVVEVNEKMKENKILGKSKTVQTIKTEVSSVDYV